MQGFCKGVEIIYVIYGLKSGNNYEKRDGRNSVNL